MLLSLSHKFLFIANVKAASSSIEGALSRHAEIAIRQTQFGKHENLSVISRKFSWVRKYVPYADFFVFGVVRDPVDWLLSLYNSHSKDDFDGLPYSTKGMPFDRFLREGFEKRWQMRPQHSRFEDELDRFHVKHLADFATLDTEFPDICKCIGIEGIELRKQNVSPRILSRDDLTKADLEFIREKYAADYDLLKNRPRAL